jgi:catechol 2,3-dioxygenase-like lactoylglutathione lyase family enzyme
MTQKEKSASICPGDFFEIGLIVPNLEKAIEQFHEALGYTFTLIMEGTLPTRDADGDSVPPLRMAVSRESPQLELVEAQPGTHLVPPGRNALHHLGYYVDDLEGESKRLTAKGIPFARGGFFGDVFPAGWVYHEMPDGTLIELVDRQQAPLRQMLMVGQTPDSPMVQGAIRLTDGWKPSRTGG